MKKITLFSLILLFFTSQALAEEVTTTKTVRIFFKENTNLRVAKESAQTYKATLNELSLKVIQRATKIAKQDKRKTVLERDIIKASEQVFRRSPMNVKELMEKIKQLSIIELVALNKKVKKYGEELIERKKEKIP